MKIYILTTGLDYEGEDIFGAYTTLEIAKEQMCTIEFQKHKRDYAEIYEVEIDAPPTEQIGIL